MSERKPCHQRGAARGKDQRKIRQGEAMTKTPGEVEPFKPITKAVRDARKAFRQVDAEKVVTEHEIAQKAFSTNRERLKA
jgi:pyridoxal biosynthesis lyase PdxS